MLKLISDSDTYEAIYDHGGPEEERPIFTLRRLSGDKVNTIDDQTTRVRADRSTDGKQPEVLVKSGTSRRLKIEASIVDWKNIQEGDGTPAECTKDNIGKLPAEVQTWLEDEIEKKNCLKGLGEEERKN